MDQAIKPKPESPLHRVPSQSKTATLGLLSRTSLSKSWAAHLGISICVGVKRSSILAEKFVSSYSPSSRGEIARERYAKNQGLGPGPEENAPPADPLQCLRQPGRRMMRSARDGGQRLWRRLTGAAAAEAMRLPRPTAIREAADRDSSPPPRKGWRRDRNDFKSNALSLIQASCRRGMRTAADFFRTPKYVFT